MTPLDIRLAWVEKIRSLIEFMHERERESIAKRLGISVERVKEQLGKGANSVMGNVLETLADHIDWLSEERDVATRERAAARAILHRIVECHPWIENDDFGPIEPVCMYCGADRPAGADKSAPEHHVDTCAWRRAFEVSHG